MKKFVILELIFAALMCSKEGTLAGQHLHYSTLSGYCEDAEVSDSGACEPEAHCRPYRHRYWLTDPTAEELHEDAGWPGRRDDELSDLLSR